MISLLQLPLEVVCSIAELLPGASLLLLRQTCRDMNVKTWEVFKREYFESRSVMLQQHSLRNLQDISEHPTLRRAVRTLRVRADRFPHSDSLQDHTDPSPPCHRDDATAKACIRAICEHQEWIGKTPLFAEDQRCLVQAMRNLSECKTLVLTDAHTPCGPARPEREVGCLFHWGFLPRSIGELDFLKHVLDVMLMAAAESKLPVEKLDIFLCDRNEPESNLPMWARLFDVPSDHTMRQRNKFGFFSTTSLRLSLNPCCGKQGSPGWELSFTRFLALFPQLSNFTLSFDLKDLRESHVIFPRILSVLSIPHLRAIDLARIEATVPKLEEVLLRHNQTLEEVILREIKLRGIGSWPSLLGKIWKMARVRYIIVKNCLIDDEWITDICPDIPNVVRITDEDSFTKVVGWMEDAGERLVTLQRERSRSNSLQCGLE